MDHLAPDIFSTLQMKGHVLHCGRVHLKVPGLLETYNWQWQWRPTIGNQLSTDRERVNEDDNFAVGVYCTKDNENELVGHLQAEFSRITAYFIQNGGEISCKVAGKRVHS